MRRFLPVLIANRVCATQPWEQTYKGSGRSSVIGVTGIFAPMAYVMVSLFSLRFFQFALKLYF